MFAIFNQKIWEDAGSPSATLENVGCSMVGLVSEDSDRPGRQAFLSVLRPSLRDDRNFETLQGWSLALPRHSGSVAACPGFYELSPYIALDYGCQFPRGSTMIR